MISAVIRERGFTPRLALRKLKEINKVVGEEVGSYWHDHFRAKHFTQAGAREYGYEKRNVRYMIKKARKWGHRDPLVWSGLSRMLSKIKDIKTTSTSARARVRVVLHTPTLNFIPSGGHINMRDEMTRVSRPEIEKLAEVAADSIDRQLSALTETSTRRIA